MVWLGIVAGLIVVAFGVVLFVVFDPRNADRIDADARLPLHEVGVSDLDVDRDADEDHEPPSA